MKLDLRIRLSAMMFFQYVIWGAWFVAMGKYLGEALHADANQIGAAYANAWMGAIVSPFIVGILGDRYFSAQKLLGIMHLLGAVVLFWLSQTNDANQVVWLILLNSVIYMSTVALTNAIGFAHIPADQTSNTTTRIAALICWIVAGLIVVFVPKTWMVWALAFALVVVAKLLTIRESKDFPTLRVWGTIGWVMVNLVIGLMEIGSTKYIFLIPAAVSVFMGLFSFFLPATPPQPNADTSIAKILGLDALVMLKDRSYLTFFLGSILLCIPLSFYYGYTALFLSEVGLTQVEAKMSVGQLSEIGFMILLPIFLKRWGVKNILIFGMIAWIARYTLLKYGDLDMVWMLYGAIILHGICYDFFFVTGQIYTDQKAGGKMRGAAQGLFTIATYGIGMTLGSRLSGLIAGNYSKKVGDHIQYDWASLWMVPLMIAIVLLVAFIVLFREQKEKAME
jgi:nucleoside transporter